MCGVSFPFISSSYLIYLYSPIGFKNEVRGLERRETGIVKGAIKVLPSGGNLVLEARVLSTRAYVYMYIYVCDS